MMHFNEIGCKIGKTALQKKKHVAHLQSQKKLDQLKKEQEEYYNRKRAYNEVSALGVEDEKLNNEQLTILLNHKKRRTDKGISGLKKKQKLHLWKEWKTRWVQPPEQHSSMVEIMSADSEQKVVQSDSSATHTDNSVSVRSALV